ncbi:sensor histidine kinase [Streptomyces jumonjinensis]|uniref:sensor histidine kinase n=1 Tax=Streptomyces jumonjinensis TaxID=1945 RepID=UPI003792E15A
MPAPSLPGLGTAGPRPRRRHQRKHSARGDAPAGTPGSGTIRTMVLTAALTVLPMTLSALFLAAAAPSRESWALIAAATVLGAGIAGAGGTRAAAAARRARAEHDRAAGQLQRLHRTVTRCHKALDQAAGHNGRGERPAPPREESAGPACPVEHALLEYHRTALEALPRSAASQQTAVILNFARRIQALSTRALRTLDTVERTLEDPDLLDDIYAIDHLVTRIRRAAESQAVVVGAIPRRVTNPAPAPKVLQQAIAEVEQYARARVIDACTSTIHGHAAADLTHLLAELVENATFFSPPQTTVELRASLVPSGLAVEIDDRGLSMDPDKLHRMNRLLTGAPDAESAPLLHHGQIGLVVVTRLAQRHGITVHLRRNVYGGTQALVVLPTALLAALSADDPSLPARAADPPRATTPPPPPAAAPGPLRLVPRAEPAGLAPPRPGDGRTPSPRSPAAPRVTSGPQQPDLSPLPRRSGGHMAPQLRRGTVETGRGGPPPAGESGSAPTGAARFIGGIRRAAGETTSPNRPNRPN